MGLQSQTRPSMHIASEVIVDIVGLISTIFVTIFPLLRLFFVLIFIFQSYVLDWQKRSFRFFYKM